MSDDDLLSKTISCLRFPLTVGVVFIHFSLARGLDIHGVGHGLGNPDWFFFIVNCVSEVLARISVPLFFVISGFLFFYRSDFNGDVYKRKLLSRVKSLLIPFVLWNIIAILWQCKCFLPGLSSFYRPVEVHFSLSRVINTFLCDTGNRGIFVGPPGVPEAEVYPINIPLWFVRDLMVMVVLSPFIYRLLVRIRQWLVIGLGVLWVFSALLLPADTTLLKYLGMLITAAFFFSWGAYYSIFKRNMVLCFRKFRHVAMLYVPIAVLDALTKGLTLNVYIHKIGILAGVVAAVVLVSYLVEAGKMRVSATLSGSVFFIYAFHRLFIGDMGKLIFLSLHLPENNPYSMLAFYLMVPLLTVMVCLSLYMVLKKYAPAACRVLTGGR